MAISPLEAEMHCTGVLGAPKTAYKVVVVTARFYIRFLALLQA